MVWTGGGGSTSDATLRRACSVMSGDPNGDDPFDLSEWTATGINDFGDLGQDHCP